ncbi:hypothetical protein PO124_18235 [Bacillus licheniformis]|nr:hypothetical protein [Bacillus licheniformis]
MKFGLLPRIITAIVLGVIVGSFAPLWFVKTAATFNDILEASLNLSFLYYYRFIIPGIGQIGSGAGKSSALRQVSPTRQPFCRPPGVPCRFKPSSRDHFRPSAAGV